MTADSITYDLTRKRRYARTTIPAGLFVGGTIALAIGGSLVQQLVVATVIAAVVGGGSYWVLCRLAAAVTGGTGYYRIAYPTHESARGVGGDRSAGGRETSDESALVDGR